MTTRRWRRSTLGPSATPTRAEATARQRRLRGGGIIYIYLDRLQNRLARRSRV